MPTQATNIFKDIKDARPLLRTLFDRDYIKKQDL